MILSVFALVAFAYSIYELFCSQSAASAARAVVRASLSILLVFIGKFQNDLIFSGFVFINLVVVLVCLSVIRNEAQE